MRFKFRFLALACFFLPFSGVAQADWVIVMETEVSEMSVPHRSTIKIKGNKTKTGDESFISQIRDLDSGVTILLIHKQKEYTVQSASMKKEAIEQLKEIMDTNPEKPTNSPKLIATGRKQQISGFDTEEYVWKGTKMQIRYWIVRNYPGYRSILSQQRRSFFEFRSLMAESPPDESKLGGLPIRTETEMTIETPPGLSQLTGTGQKKTSRSVSTLISLKEGNLDDAEFEIPAGYKKSGSSAPRNVNDSTKGLREVIEKMRASGMPESDLKKFDQMIENKTGKQEP